MTKQTIISLALITGSALLLGGCSINNVIKTPQSSQAPQSTVNDATKLADAIKSGTPTYCVMTKDSDKMEYWVKGKMFKMDSVKTTTDNPDNKPIVTSSHVISDATYMYSWGEGAKQGVKIKIPTEDEMKQMTVDAKKYQDSTPKFGDENGYNDLKSQGYTIDCKSTDIADSAFIPPADITFGDPTDMIKALAPGADGKVDMKKIQELQKKYSVAPVAGDGGDE